MKYIWRETLRSFRRAPLLSALSVTTIAFSLFAFGLFGLAALNIRDLLNQAEERVEILAFVADGTAIETVGAATRDIGGFPEVASALYISPEEAVEKARAEVTDYGEIFDEGALLPGSVEVRLKPGFRDPDNVAAVAQRIAAYGFIDDIRYGEEWVTRLHRLRTVTTVAGVAMGLAFAAVAIIIIGATIRMAVLARSREIAIMRLVGATAGFIRRPFLLEGFLKGVAGGLVALALLWSSSQLISRIFPDAAFFSAKMILIGLIAGAFMGLVGSSASVGRHLKRV